MKVDEFIADIREGKTFGPIRACQQFIPPSQAFIILCWFNLILIFLLTVLYTVEFQKRGLPHIHYLVWLAANNSEFNASTFDKFICAEIPDINI